MPSCSELQFPFPFPSSSFPSSLEVLLFCSNSPLFMIFSRKSLPKLPHYVILPYLNSRKYNPTLKLKQGKSICRMHHLYLLMKVLLCLVYGNINSTAHDQSCTIFLRGLPALVLCFPRCLCCMLRTDCWSL